MELEEQIERPVSEPSLVLSPDDGQHLEPAARDDLVLELRLTSYCSRGR